VKKIGTTGILVILIIVIAGYSILPNIKRLLIVNSFFNEDVIVDNFQNIEEIFPSTDVPASSRKLILPQKLDYKFPSSFFFQNTEFQTQDFLKATSTEGLLVIYKDTIIYEKYFLGLEPDEKHISWSVSKSFIGTMIGIANEKGILDLSDKVEDHLPEFRNTGYEGVTVEQLLQMRSGIRFDENYGDFNSDINRFGRAFALGTSYQKFASSLSNEVPPGSRCQYVSIDTQMLGFLLTKVTGKTLTELLHTWLWQPMGMEHNGGWIKDNVDFEMALGGMTATLRDYAKLGLLYLNDGTLNGHRVVSKSWINKATAVYEDGSGERWNRGSGYGYGYQWWIPPHSTGDYFAVGIYDQFVYVHPEKELIIAKLSADHHFRTDGSRIKAQHVAFFQQVAAQID